MTGAEEMCRIADRIVRRFPDEAARLLEIADEHRRMTTALDEIVSMSFNVFWHARQATQEKINEIS